MNAMLKKIATDEGAPANVRRTLNEQEARYMQGDRPPATSSVLISNSKYLNDPYYRDTFAQQSLRRHGEDLPPTYLVPAMTKAVTQVTDFAEAQRLVDAEKERNPEFKAFLSTRIDQDLRPETTAGYAPGTFGAMIHDFLVNSGMKLDFMYAGETAGDLAYIAKRLLAVHDIGHMITGFGPNTVGEVALNVCTLTTHFNYFSPALAGYINHTSTWVPVNSLMYCTLHYPAVMATMYEGVALGIAAGRAIRLPFFMTDWTRYLARTPDEIAGELGFVRGPGDEWAWTTAAATG